MFKLQTLNHLYEFLTSSEDSLVHTQGIKVEFQRETELRVGTNRIEDLEHDLFAFMTLKHNKGPEGAMICCTMVESIRFIPVFNGIVIYIAE